MSRVHPLFYFFQEIGAQAENEYTVQNIVDSRIGKDCVTEYLVDWGAKWGEERYGWEPVTNLTHCGDKIEEYLRRKEHPGNKGGGKKRKRKGGASE